MSNPLEAVLDCLKDFPDEILHSNGSFCNGCWVILTHGG